MYSISIIKFKVTAERSCYLYGDPIRTEHTSRRRLSRHKPVELDVTQVKLDGVQLFPFQDVCAAYGQAFS